jgi:hypothetical protein
VTGQDPRNTFMLGRTIKPTWLTVLRGVPSLGKTGGIADARVARSSLPVAGMQGIGVPAIVGVTGIMGKRGSTKLQSS